MPGVHAKLSPSGAPGWMRCEGWQASSESSVYADEGTDAHTLAALALESERQCADFLGRALPLGNVVDEGMADAVQKYVDLCRSLPGFKFYEVRAPIEFITCEKDAAGTADCGAVLEHEDELLIVDLKYGMGVQVFAEDNEQLLMYLAALRRMLEQFGPFKRFRVMICQPRLGHVDEWAVTGEQLDAFIADAGQRARDHAEGEAAGSRPERWNPGEKACMWCARKPHCKVLAAHVGNQVGASFEDISASLTDPEETRQVADEINPGPSSDELLAMKMAAVELVEDWCRAVRAEVERRLLAGKPISGWKLVEGRAANSAWSDETAAEQRLKALRLKFDEMYSSKLKSPTQLKNLLQKARPKLWTKVAALIAERGPGKKSVAPESDRRPAITIEPVADGFDNLRPEV